MDKFIKFVIVVGILFVGMKVLGISPLGGGGGKGIEALQKQAKAEGKDKIVILLTGTSWCTYCKELDRAVISKPEWKSYIGTEAVFASYEYGAVNRPKSGVNGEMLKRFDIEGFPTLIVLNQDGDVIGERAGYGSGDVSVYKNWINSL